MNKQRGFAPVIILVVVGAVIAVGVIIFATTLIKPKGAGTSSIVSVSASPKGSALPFSKADLPGGKIVTNDSGEFCETGDAKYCHDNVNIYAVKDDGFK